MGSPFPPDLSDDELMDEARRSSQKITFTGPPYLEELNRRAVDRQTKQVITLTDEIRRLTVHLRWLTAGAVGLAIIAIVITIIAIVLDRPG